MSKHHPGPPPTVEEVVAQQQCMFLLISSKHVQKLLEHEDREERGKQKVRKAESDIGERGGEK